MLLRALEVRNFGPIAGLELKFTETEDRIHPVILVGGNGSGKTLLVSQIINAVVSAKQTAFSDPEVEKGRSFRYRSPLYIRSNEDYYYCRTIFTNNLELSEVQLRTPKGDFENELNYCPAVKAWASMSNEATSALDSNFSLHRSTIKSLLSSMCIKFFPANRFEEPAWLNEKSLTFRANFQRDENIEGHSRRKIFEVSPLAENANWLLKVILDRQTAEGKIIPEHVRSRFAAAGHSMGPIAFVGRSSTIFNEINNFLKTIFPDLDDPKIKIGNRFNDLISIYNGENLIVPNIFQLSSGEMQLLNIFMCILRDYDITGEKLGALADVRGLVIIDEADLNLHSRLQIHGISKIIEILPRVQFIISTHSPLMVLGLAERLGESNLKIVELPAGQKLIASDFSEVRESYEAFKKTVLHRKEISDEITQASKPILYVEGLTDILYIKRAAELLGFEGSIKEIEFKDGGGYRKLDSIWKSLENDLVNNIVNRHVMILYDCDTGRTSKKRNIYSRFVLPSIENNPIKTGIENLFHNEVIERARAEQAKFFDIKLPTEEIIRGEKLDVPMMISVNENEKMNLCEWICANGEASDFRDFRRIFEWIGESLI